MEVDPATHDAVIAALGKVCAVTHALLPSKNGVETLGASVGCSHDHCILHCILLVALRCSCQHVVYPVDCHGQMCALSLLAEIA